MVLEGLLRSVVWLLRAEELPPLPAGSIRLPPPPRKVARHRLHAREYQLLLLLRIDGVLALALGTSPVMGHTVDRRWKN